MDRRFTATHNKSWLIRWTHSRHFQDYMVLIQKTGYKPMMKYGNPLSLCKLPT